MMKKSFLKLLILTVFLFGFAGLASAQTSMTQTTLAAAQNVGVSGGASGANTGNFDTTINLTSATGVQVANGVNPVTIVYVGNEAEGILSLVIGQTTIYNVQRGIMGTKTGPHVSGDMVLIQATSPQYSGNTGSGGFQITDPPLNGACTAASTLVTPWVNVQTGAQWICSSLTLTWGPGWNNPLAGKFGQTATVASAAGAVTPSGPYFNISGTAAITGFNIPVGFNATAAGGGCFMVKPTGIFTWTAAGNISTAGTTTAITTPVSFCWDTVLAKWVPSRLS
jgi:hypothetical protein